MDTSHDIVTREVTRYMRATGLSQAAIATSIGLRQSALSKRIRGELRWSLTDLDRLADAGVPIHLTTKTLDRETQS